MISICIPIYNYDANLLVESILAQADASEIIIEILIGDDCSTSKFNNSKLNKGDKVRYIYNEQNFGRSKNRNELAKKARFNYLLFIDCDAQLQSANFLSLYYKSISENCQVVCGGTAYTKEKQAKIYNLHWKYGSTVEAKPIEERKKEPNQSFSSFNFLIKKDLFLSIKFNESLTKYGHEDTLLGYELKKKGIQITQIDNPLIHTGIEDNKIFLEKTLTGLNNLIYIIKNVETSPDFINDIKLLKFHRKLKKKGVTSLLIFFYPILFPISKFILLNIKSDIKLFNFVKILYFTKNF